MGIFDKRVEMKPYEYPHLLDFKDAIRHSYWVHEEFMGELNSDVQDYHTNLTHSEKELAKKAMLAIAQIEISVKEFWGDIYKRMPKPEIGAVGYTFAESEVRHQDSYAALLELLGLNSEFKKIPEIPAIQDRIDYLSEYIGGRKNGDDESYAMAVLLFSVFIEHVSLFSQFLIMMAFNRHKGVLKGISNVVEATSKEEQIHGEFGVAIIKIIKQENPEWFGEEFKEVVVKSCEKAYKAENKILDWMYEEGDVDFIPKETVQEYLKDRFNKALKNIDLEPIFEVDDNIVSDTMWFEEEVLSSAHVDFFHKRPTSYSKNNKSFSEEDLF